MFKAENFSNDDEIFRISEEQEARDRKEKREETFESALGPLGFRTLNKKNVQKERKKKIFKNFCGERRTSKNEALKSTHEALKP